MELLVVFTASSAARRSAICSRVRSGSRPTSASSQAVCASSGERLRRPAGRRSTRPVSSTCFTQRTAVAELTRTCRPASRREAPASNSEIISARTSSEYGLRPDIPASSARGQGTHIRPCRGIPSEITFDSSKPGNALADALIAGRAGRHPRRLSLAKRGQAVDDQRPEDDGGQDIGDRRSFTCVRPAALPVHPAIGVPPAHVPYAGAGLGPTNDLKGDSP